MTSTELADWMYASEFMAQFGDEAPDELLRQLKHLNEVGDHEGGRRLIKLADLMEAFTWGPADGPLN